MSKADFHFDQLVNRKGTDSIKWDACAKIFGEKTPDDVLPMWVADMDFYPPASLTERVIERAKHPIYGYTFVPEALPGIAKAWIKRHYRRDIEEEAFVFSPGIVPAIGVAMRALLEEGDGVMIFAPVYGPFYKSIELNKMTEQAVPLKQEGRHWSLDFEAMEEAVNEKTKMLVFCSPHNPIGRVWRQEELERLRDFVVKHDLWVVSDEIHADFIYSGHEQLSIASLEGMKERTITCYAPSKTFSIAGLACSGIIIEDPKLRQKFETELQRSGLHGNVFAYTAMMCVWQEGDLWLKGLMDYLEGNRDYLLEAFGELEERGIVAQPPEATFLMFLDCQKFMEKEGMKTQEELNSFFLEKAGLALNPGTDFGPRGEGFVRLNFGCPRHLLTEAIERIKKALS